MLGHKQHSIDKHNRRKCIEWEAVDHRPNSFFDDPNLPLDFRHMLVSTAQIQLGGSIELGHHVNQWLKFPISLDEHNLKTALKVVVVHGF